MVWSLSQTNFQRNIAVVIGINNYQNGIHQLKTAVNDAKAVADLLENEYNYQKVVRLFPEHGETTLAALNQLLFDILPNKIKPTESDRLLFYFAGHGIARNSEDGPAGALIPQDANLGNWETYLPMKKLNEALSQLECHHLLVMLDCCFAGNFRWSSHRNVIPEFETIHREHYDRFIRYPAWQAITSAAHNQEALDYTDERGIAPDNQHSPFAKALINGLKDMKADFTGDGVITAPELYLYLRDNLMDKDGSSELQTAGLWPLQKHDRGEFIFTLPGFMPEKLKPAPPLDASKNPYRGLESFDEKHNELFFGRTEQVKKLQDFVKTHALTVVLGASGSGKSSLVKAGLIPQLRQNQTEKWFVIPPIRPGETPLQALNNTLKDAQFSEIQPQQPEKNLAWSIEVWAKNNPNSKLLLFIDQSEEIITLCQNEDVRKEFFQQILTAIDAHRDKLRVVLSLRSDFEPQVRDVGFKFIPKGYSVKNTELKNRWQSGRFIVSPMTRGELREAIQKPAEARVMFFQPQELVEQLIDEVADMPGALPLLSFALSELYLKYLKRQRDAEIEGKIIERAMTQKDYEDLGGVIQSLTQRADEEYEALVKGDEAYAQIIRHVMLRMVAIGGGELARRRVPLSELKYPSEKNNLVEKVIERFSKARLLVPGQNAEGELYVEPAHDALVRGWSKIKNWLDERQEKAKKRSISLPFQKKSENPLKINLVLQRSVTNAADNWWSKKISDGYIKAIGFLWYDDPRLPQLKQIQQSEDNWFNITETKFVNRSILQKRINIGVITAIGASIFLAVLWQWQLSQLREKAARSENLLQTEPLEGLVLAIESTGHNLWLSRWLPWQKMLPQVQSSLLSAVQTSRERQRFDLNSQQVKRITSSPQQQNVTSSDGKLLVKDNCIVEVLQNNSSAKQKKIGCQEYSEGFRSISSNSNPKQILSNLNPDYSESGMYEQSFSTLWNKTDEDKWLPSSLIPARSGFLSKILFAAFSPNYNTIIGSSQDGRIHFWDNSIDVSVGSVKDNKTQLWDSSKKEIGQPLLGHTSNVESVAFSSDSKTIISSSWDGSIRLWDVEQNLSEEKSFPSQNTDPIVELSRDGQKIIISSKTGASVQDLDGKLIGKFPESVEYVALSPNGQVMVDKVNQGEESHLYLLYRDGTPKKKLLDSYASAVNFSPDSQKIAIGFFDEDKGIGLWDIEGNKIGQFQKNDEGFSVGSIAFSPDGQQLVSGSLNYGLKGSPPQSSVCLWSVQADGLNKIEPCKLIPGELMEVGFSPDQKKVVIGLDNGGLYLWNLKKKQISNPFGRDGHPITSLAFSPDSKIFATGDINNSIRLWNVIDEAPIGDAFLSYNNPRRYIISPEFGNSSFSSASVFSVAFKPDGKSVMATYADGSLRTWKITWESWLEVGCNRLRNHSIFINPSTNVARGAKKTCEQYVWKDSNLSKQNLPISKGEKSLIPTLLTFEKKVGLTSIEIGDFKTAIQSLKAHLQNQPNDPEALIYLNNALIGNQPSYTIAISAPIGSDVNGALEMLRGVAQAQKEINEAGGINKVPLRILIADDNNKPDTAKQIAEELVKNPDVLGVVGHYASDVTLATGKVYQAGKLVAVSPTSTAVKLTGSGDYIFRTVPNDSVAAKALADYMQKQLEKKNASVFYNSQSDYSESLKSEFVKFLRKQGGEVSSKLIFDLSDPNFNADQSVEQSIESGAEVLVLLPNTAELDDTLKVVKANKQRLPLLGGDDVYTPKILKDGGADAGEMVVAVPWHILASQTDFPETSRSLWKADVNWRTAMSYDATIALIEGLKNNPTREGLAQSLRSKDFAAKGATGEVKFNQFGDRDQNIQLVKIQPNSKSRSKYGYDFEPISE
ncbi:ABC transporter substrate-binding protein [Limnoraphis robusta]|uniref:ABC transporter substrate-binding protein n=1 Tax=Limnoraphis robusta CCNP1315 TaxID=3110306 RepID=A0ABU5TW86_9CYAN|nr:ABC transporter substrate-binding protein [Limnoraphis robusta]MEA5518808.1 ABC transporter substrate-binding protein [Limnoraphis robusta CCNP1315]MEA5548707.1 ABC transporter substrate-binding protein [Limnoraphis robusta CCNP1324]